MPAHKKTEVAAKYWELYSQGFSCADVAEIFGVRRSSVWKILKNHGYKLRELKRLPFLDFEGKRYTPNFAGYYRSTEREHNIFLHRVIWEKHYGQIPVGYDIHHLNGDKADNRIENLQCLLSAEHTRLHRPGKEYQFKPGCLSHNARAVRRTDTFEVYSSARQAACSVGRSSSAIQIALKNKTKSAGTYWEYAD
jgi:hypothetical protein